MIIHLYRVIEWPKCWLGCILCYFNKLGLLSSKSSPPDRYGGIGLTSLNFLTSKVETMTEEFRYFWEGLSSQTTLTKVVGEGEEVKNQLEMGLDLRTGSSELENLNNN